MGSYRFFNGEKFYTDDRAYRSRDKAKQMAEYWKKDVKSAYPDFPFRYRIVSAKDGYKLYMNNIVENMRDYPPVVKPQRGK